MSTTQEGTTTYLAAQNLVEPRLHLIADNSTLTMLCGKHLTGYWYGKITAASVVADKNGVCEECKAALKKQGE